MMLFVHIVENYKLTLSTNKEDHTRVWYSQLEMAELAREEYLYRFGHHNRKEESPSLLSNKQEQQLTAARQKIMDRLGAAAVPHGVLGVRQSMAIARRANNKARHTMTSTNKTNNILSTHDALAVLRRGRHPRHHNRHSTNIARIVQNNPVAVQHHQQQQSSSLNNNKKAKADTAAAATTNVVPATGRTSSLSPPSRLYRSWLSEMYHSHSLNKQ